MASAIAQLDAKIAEHKEQLEQVTQLLALQPTDESLRQLLADINTELTNALQLRITAGVTAAPTTYGSTAASLVPAAPLPPQHKTDSSASSASASAASSSSASSSSSSSSAADAAGAGAATAAAVPPPPLPDIAAAASAAAAAAAALAAVTTTGSTRKWQVKERVFAQWTDGKFYVARIDSISELLIYKVTYLDYGNTAEVTVAQLYPYIHAPIGLLKPGVLVRAVWPNDGLFYDAKIEGGGSARGLFAVKFTKYKNTKIEVPVEDIIIRKAVPNAFGDSKDSAAAFAPTAAAGATGMSAFGATGGLTEAEVKELLALQAAPEYSPLAISAAAAAAAAASATAASAALKKEPIVELGEKVVIPESLTILPTDSEQTKALKLKKIKRLKNKHRHAVLEQQGEKKQNSWQKFTQKAARVSGGAVPGTAKPVGAQEKKLLKNKDALDSLKVLGHKRKSIFSSPDSVDGRVGVTGSGKTMTEYKDMGRAKFVKADGSVSATGPIPTPYDE